MKTETIITLSKAEAIKMLLNANPHVKQFIIEEPYLVRRFIHTTDGFVPATAYVEIDLNTDVPTLVLKNGTREPAPTYWKLKDALHFVKIGVWREIPVD